MLLSWGLRWFGFEQFVLFLTRLKRTMCQVVIISLRWTESGAKYPDLSPLTVTLVAFHQGNLSSPSFSFPSAGLLFPLAKFLQWFHLFHCFLGLSNLGKKNTPCFCSAMAAVWCCKSDILFHNKALTACFLCSRFNVFLKSCSIWNPDTSTHQAFIVFFFFNVAKSLFIQATPAHWERVHLCLNRWYFTAITAV